MSLVFLGETLIDGTGREPISNAVIKIEDGKITQVGFRNSVTLDSGEDQVIDLGSLTILPGLIDSHCHIFVITGQIIRNHPEEWEPEQWVSVVNEGIKGALLWLDQGVTTIRDVGCWGNLDLGLRNLIAQGKITGPRIFGSGRAIAMPGRSAMSAHEVSSSGEARRAARDQLRAGADLIKLFASAGVGGAYGKMVGESGWEQLTVEEMQAAVYEAHKAGRTATAHAHHPQSIKNAILAGVDSIEHGHYIDEECLIMMKERGLFLVPTVFVTDVLSRRGSQMGHHPSMNDKAQMAMSRGYQSVRMAREVGVPIAVGTDPGHQEESVVLECLALNRAGLTAMEVIVAATRTGAELLGIHSNLGTLETGKVADLIAVQGNPLEDLTSLDRVQWVIKEGQVIKGQNGNFRN